jgi:hypothetical protein
MATEIRTSRGIYRIGAAAPIEQDATGIVVTAGLERADGIERVVARFRVDRQLDPPTAVDAILARLGPWIEKEFEATREAALKSIRTERKLWEIVFDENRPGPFARSTAS